MARSSRDRISVDLRGLRAALLEQARAHGLRPSDLVRSAISHSLGEGAPFISSKPVGTAQTNADRVRLTLRMPRVDALWAVRAARVAGLSPGEYVAGLVAGVPVLVHGAGRVEHLTALAASSAELSTLSRNIHHLTALLR